MEKFKEKRIVEVLDAICLVIMLIFLASLIIGIFYHAFLFGFLLLPIVMIIIVISQSLSKKNEYTRGFIIYIKDKVKKAKSLDELNQILNEFESLAIEDGMICLSFPADIKIISRDLISKIEILELQDRVNGNKN